MECNNVHIPRPEYPRPQLVRKDWKNLNGIWDFEFDFGSSGKARQMFLSGEFTKKILVPFCPESKLSGVEYKDFMNCVWYRRSFTIPDIWAGKRVKIHFGAVDYAAEVWINGISVGKHSGGYCSFFFDITEELQKGENTVIVCAEDDNRSGLQPRGKQSAYYYSAGCDYTRTTGIWQTVWLEVLPESYLEEVKLTPYVNQVSVLVEGKLNRTVKAAKVQLTATFKGEVMAEEGVQITGDQFAVQMKLKEKYVWEPGNPNLYDLKISVYSENSVDEVESYFGLRSVSLKDGAILINERPVFQRLILDQGFYPEGIYTAPTDEELKEDIERSMAMGFNGARLHQKVFEPRFLYWADKLGYLVWGEHGNWGLNITTSIGLERFLPEWMEILIRDYNHPSIVGWCPFNETWDMNGTRQDDEVLRIVYQVSKAMDKTRPVIDTSGNFHVVTDIFDVHDYDQNTETFEKRYEVMASGGDVFVTFPDRQKYEGQPYFVSEYGGIWWNPDQKDEKSWGYGQRPISEEEFIDRYRGLTTTLLTNPKICAFCYTQLTDVEQEVNGLYTYDRKAKFDPEVIKKINTQKAAIE